jgi:hypothetical protein
LQVLLGLLDLVLGDGSLGIARSGQDLVEAKLGGAPDHVHGPVGVCDAGNVHDHLVLALELYLRLCYTEAIDSLAYHLRGLIHLVAGNLRAIGVIPLERSAHASLKIETK